MLTRCPHCQTTFRVGTEQLKVRQGKVRCGQCSEVFDALDALTDEVAVVTAVPPVASEPEPETELEAVPEPEPELETEPEPEPEPEPVVQPEQAEEKVEEEALPEELPLPEEWHSVEPAAEPRRWPWVTGALLFILLAAAQLLYVFRVELAVLAPELRPALKATCELLGCEVPHPRKPELVGIETSDLAPETDGRLQLTALLKNRAPFVQEYPYLELTLTDTRDEAILRKVLRPAEYLRADKVAADGFAARSELPVQLVLETSGVAAVGYRLYLFYP
jgi:predicted Zn finger-like uncharacterized protein